MYEHLQLHINLYKSILQDRSSDTFCTTDVDFFYRLIIEMPFHIAAYFGSLWYLLPRHLTIVATLEEYAFVQSDTVVYRFACTYCYSVDSYSSLGCFLKYLFSVHLLSPNLHIYVIGN